jgi:hypothetical protein
MEDESTLALIRQVFPTGADIQLEPQGLAPSHQFLIVPGHQAPRWIVPRNPQAGYTVLCQWHPFGLPSRLKWAGLLAAYAGGLLDRLPGVLSVGVPNLAALDWRELEWHQAAPPAAVFYIGTPGPGRKAVASLIAPQAPHTAQISKVPLAAHAATRILIEAEVLERLGNERPGVAPALLSVDRHRGVSAQARAPGRLGQRELTTCHLDYLGRLGLDGATTSLAAAVEALRPRLSANGALDAVRHTVLARLLDQLDDEAPLPAVWEHGDFAPWNLVWDGDRLTAVDWEEASAPGIPMVDVFHFVWIQSFLFGERPALEARLVQRYCRQLGMPASRLEQLRLYYQAATAIRRYEFDPADPYANYLLEYARST